MDKHIKCIALLFILSLVIVAASYSDDKMWKWVDGKGGVHYTDNLGNVPYKYRNMAESLSLYRPPQYKRPSKIYTPLSPSSTQHHIYIKEKKKKKLLSASDISLLKEFVSHIAKEIERDMEIIEMVNNEIAIRMTSGFLHRDLPLKSKLLNKIIKIRDINTDKEFIWLSKNIDIEYDIVNNMLDPNNTYKFMAAKNLIKAAIPKKKNLIDIFKSRIDK